MSDCSIYEKMFNAKISIDAALKIKKEILEYEKNQKNQEGNLLKVNKKLHHKFFYEFCPTIKLAQYTNGNEISVIKDDSLRYDAKIYYNNHDRNIEWVTAIPNQDEMALKMEYLAIFKEVPLTNDIKYQGNKNSGRTFERTPRKVVKAEDYYIKRCNEISNEVIKNFNKKVQLQNKSNIYIDAILGVLIDCNLFGIDQKYLKIINIKFKQAIKNHYFSEIYLLGELKNEYEYISKIF